MDQNYQIQLNGYRSPKLLPKKFNNIHDSESLNLPYQNPRKHFNLPHKSSEQTQEIQGSNQKTLVDTNDKPKTTFSYQTSSFNFDKLSRPDEKPQTKLATSACATAIGSLILGCAILGGSSIGVLANFIPIESSFAKNAWRSGLNVVIFTVPTLIEYYFQRSKVDYSNLLTLKHYLILLVTLACQVIWTFGLIYASLHTIQSQAYVFNNIHGLFILLILCFQGILPSKKELIGLALAVVGCFCMLSDPKAALANGNQASIGAACIDIGSAIFGAFYFILSARNVKNMPICFLIWLMNLHTLLFNSLIAKLEAPSNITILSFNVEHGCLGFMNLVDQPLMPILMYAIFASFFGSAGYTLSLLFFSPLVSSSAYLIEPLIAQSLGYAIGLDKLPGILTLLGAIFALQGILFIERGSRQRLANEAKDLDNSYMDDCSMAQSMFNHTISKSQSDFSYNYNGSRLSAR